MKYKFGMVFLGTRYKILIILFFGCSFAFAQLPQEWHIGKFKVLDFKNEPPTIVDDVRIDVKAKYNPMGNVEYLDSNNTEHLVFNNGNVISVKTGNIIGKMPVDGILISVFEDLIFYVTKVDLKYKYILEDFKNQEKLDVDTGIQKDNGEPYLGYPWIYDARIYKDANNKILIVANAGIRSNNGFFESAYLIFYHVENGRVVNKKIYPMKDQFPYSEKIRGVVTEIFDISKNGKIAFSFYSRYAAIGTIGFSNLCTANISENGLTDFKVFHTGRNFKTNDLDTLWSHKQESYYETMKFSSNDSFIYGVRHLLEKEANPDINKQLLWNGEASIDRFSGSDFNSIDSSKFFVSINLPYNAGLATLKDARIGPNGDIFFSRFLDDKINYIAIIRKPESPGKLSDKINVKSIYISNAINDRDNYALPQSNKNYIKLRFLKGKTCTDDLRLFADADTFYKEFHWFVANDSGSFDSSYGRNLHYPVNGQNKFYVKMKGIAANGYYAWYSDTVEVHSRPQASFAADTSAWCQWVGLKMKNLSYSENAIKNDFTWQVMKGDTVENTFKGTSPFISFGQTGKYAIRLIYNDGYCTDTFTQTAAINIIEAPKPGFSLSDSIICDGDQVTVTDESQGRITSRKFTWSDGFTDNSTGHSRRFELPGYYKLKQSLRGPTGCVTGDSAHVRVRAGVDQNTQPEMLTANVLDSQTVEIRWKAFANASYYDLLRNDGVKYTISNSAIDSLLDSYLFTSNASYQYHLQAVDSCGRTTLKSSPATTILLESENQNNEYVILEWNAYEQWTAGVSNYQIEFSEEGSNWQTLDNPVTLDYRFTNDKSADSLYFRIIANEKDGNQQTSISNIVKERFTSTLFIPNAFSPNGDGLNDVFQIKGIGIATIDCTIWARNGQYLHHSTNPENLWDGMRLGEKLGPGAYFYQFKATTVNGKEISQNGVLILVE